MITLQKSQVWLNATASSTHPEQQGQIPVYFTKKDAQEAAASVGWNKSDVKKVQISSGLYREGWAIVNTLAGEYQVFRIGAEPQSVSW